MIYVGFAAGVFVGICISALYVAFWQEIEMMLTPDDDPLGMKEAAIILRQRGITRGGEGTEAMPFKMKV